MDDGGDLHVADENLRVTDKVGEVHRVRIHHKCSGRESACDGQISEADAEITQGVQLIMPPATVTRIGVADGRSRELELILL